MAARGNHKELVIGRKAVHPLLVPAVGPRCLALFCMCPHILVAHMSEKRYRQRVIANYKAIGRQFLRYLRHIRISIDTVQSEHVQRFLRGRLSKYRRRHGRSPSDTESWRAREAPAIRMLLRVLRGQWPPSPIPRSVPERTLDEVLRGYDEWMREARGLCLSTRENRIAEALRFMKSLRIEGRAAWSDDISISGIDAYVASRTVSRRTRGSLKSATVDLRRLLRYLKISGWIKHDLSGEILVPKCYKLEDLPRELRAEHVDKVLETTRADHSAIGRRDYAILTLLATYGLRAGEIIGLRLEDIDWKNDILRVRRGKSGASRGAPAPTPPRQHNPGLPSPRSSENGCSAGLCAHGCTLHRARCSHHPDQTAARSRGCDLAGTPRTACLPPCPRGKLAARGRDDQRDR